LSFGIERETIGDICILDDHSAIIFCNAEVEKYLLSVMESVGNDKVKLSGITVDINMPSTQKYQAFTDTVASERLDCVVASLCNLAREKGQNLIKGGLVEHNYETAVKIDTRVVAGDIISARGYGKFVIRDISQTTKKGRIRLLADKYI
jgi:RNA-binding protein YlmH